MVSKGKEINAEEFEKILSECEAKMSGLSEDDWQDIIDRHDLDINRDTLRKNCTGIFGSVFVKQYYEEKNAKEEYSDDEYIQKLEDKKRELERARIKLNSDKIEYNKWLREDCRNEMIVEKLVDAISQLEPLNVPSPLSYKENDRAFLLCFGDEHYGTELSVKDLFGHEINKYSPEIFEIRMNELLSQVIEIIKKENIRVLNIFSMGDEIDGILRVSQLMKLRYGVVESTIKYAEFISNWLNELSNYVNIKYYHTNGNHSELRMIGQPKGTFIEDNMDKVVVEFIRERLKDNQNFQIIENPTGYMFTQLCDYHVLGFHGETKNMTQQMQDFEKIYGVPIDYLIAGHLHHSKSETVGINSEVINIPSIIGIDDYSMKLNKTSNAGATLLVFEKFKGKVVQYDIKFYQ